ncbi:glycerol-3-phosphate dehydrogenase [Edwardsiella hoshinae]|uniref:Glycerol-3-phosphate dehydrogenase n=1 Tax=Edwardsiella hoshinae TaxID=93378 RepID=A0A376D6H7_9GAMM|nr:glycerol-3-phosphate dehydrogenase [Edwardsiella hoshinae]AOV95640.1 glycerol-3-phosphate dehydrogenase [Edwardsiella hoshinae]QPR28511.1 glycerol-3-phosphate dehydrogenase [Edwardsiella hoshinae]STC83028.1 Aerobic glycerol-3-phosphate dehydrogenase [Edwardsiella hoshinae]
MEIKDVIVIGGGINGAGIAADAAGRGLSVLMLEARDLACATSSASSKLIHGGLRYLEHYEFRLVSEALAEREVLLKMAPHIAFPLRFRLPHQPHLRPAWMIRAGLFLYDHLGKRTTLPGSRSLRFAADSVLQPNLTRGFEYSDCWVDDARLVVLNAMAVAEKGGEVRTRTEVTRAWREQGLWVVEARDTLSGECLTWRARGLVNATGPWVKQFFDDSLQLKSPYGIRLIKGSHIVVPRVHDQPQAYILQNEDQRIVFVIPWLDEFSIIGTTDVEYHGDPRAVAIDDQEIDYLLRVYNRHFQRPLSRQDIVWCYSGVRPLCDDESDAPQAITRDYTLDIHDQNGQAPLLSVFGGKLTTYRKLAEHALEKLRPYYTHCGDAWTKGAVLPGGEMGCDRDSYAVALQRRHGWLPPALARRYAHTYGARSERVIGVATSLAALGEHFGHGLYEAELRYLMAQEWVVTAEDALWRRTKLGMWLDETQRQRVADWLAVQRAA